MKRFISIFAIIIFTVTLSSAQNKKGIITEKVKVEGICDQCKKRIENAAYIPGVKRADWDKTSKELTVIYKEPKATLEKIEESISKSGHTTEHNPASDSAYQNLPSCCAYLDGHDH